MLDWRFAVGLAVAAGVASWGGTWLVLRALRARRILDEPNPRSSHSEPTPRGAGIAVVAVLVGGLIAQAWIGGNRDGLLGTLLVVGLTAALALVSWLDDLRSLSAAPRFGAQLVAVAAAGWMIWRDAHGTGDIGLEILVGIGCLLGWLWFVNLFNFMDGIDGIAGVETAGIGAGFLALALLTPDLSWLAAYGLLLAAVAIGFLVWNWHPARIFLGDVGSIPLGFVIGFLLVTLAVNGYWLEALILPLYYWADATLTIGRRLLRGQPPWRAHREHFYQRAVAGGLSHGRVATIVAGANVALVGLAALAVSGWPIVAAVVAAVVVAAVLCYFGLTGAIAPR